MTIQHLSDVKTIARAAHQIGATLPAEITSALVHLEDLTRNTPAPLRPGTLASQLADHIGNPAKMDKALNTAAAELATNEAATKIHGYLAETCGGRIRSMMRLHATEVTNAFGTALAADLDTLNATAGNLPAWFTEDNAGDLDPITFEQWSRARDAYARIQTASNALTPLYAGSIPHEHGAQFPISAAASLRIAEPPTFDTPREAYAFRDALAGRTERVQGLAGQGSTFVDGLFIPTVLAHAGATFEWATPAQVTERAELIVTGIVRQHAGAARVS